MAKNELQGRKPGAALNELLSKPAVLDMIGRGLPKHLTAERLITMATTVFARNTELQKCDLGSIVGCVVQAGELGLELSGPLGEAYMVPRWNGKTKQLEATFQVGYRGYFQLGFRSGRVLKNPMRTVYANDVFSIEYGTQDRIVHRPAMGDRGAPIGYYCCVFLKGGVTDFEFMTQEQGEAHRDRYAQKDKDGKLSSYSPWITNPEPMFLKTPTRRLFKRVPLSVEMQKAAVWDEYEEQGLFQHRPELPLSRADFVGAKLGADNGQEAASEPERGEEGGGARKPVDKQMKALGQHFTRLGMGPDEVDSALADFNASDLRELTAEQADQLLQQLAARPTPAGNGVGAAAE